MNARILKKLSKRAAPLLAALGDKREQFKVGDDDYIPSWQFNGFERKSLDRFRGKVRDWIVPLKGTQAVGATSGYYEPEWSDEPAYMAMHILVIEGFSAYRIEGGDIDVVALRILRNPSQVFAAVPEAVRRLKVDV